MALINCPECGKEVSDKAASCPNCGCPIEKEEIQETRSEDILIFPTLPSDLNIGQQITNWKLDAAIDGYYDHGENSIKQIAHGKVNVALHTHGIQIFKGVSFFPIHNSQIISINTAWREDLVKTDKSVIGRAVVGGLILGPLGAIVGGMSGIGSKEKYENKYYIIINYWDPQTKSAQTLLISGSQAQIDMFINRHNQEKITNETENRVAKQNTTPVWAIICLIIIAISIFIIIFS